MTSIYDRIGRTYSVTRKADPRIAGRLSELLQLAPGASLIDIGAGTGNYSFALAEAGFRVTALEPSPVMRSQGRQHPRLDWREGVAESLPFADGEFDGAVMTLCLHHLDDWRKGIAEACRVSGDGPLVIFLFDALRKKDFWLDEYFPDLVKIDVEWGFSIDDIIQYAHSLKLQCESMPFPLPPDLQDHFFASGWARPEIYLDEKYRAGISSFSRIDRAALDAGLEALSRDLKSGRWHSRFGALQSLAELDLGYLFMKLSPLREGG